MSIMNEFKKRRLTREGRILISTLNVSQRMDVSTSRTGRLLQSKGFIGNNGRITRKGKAALREL